MEAPSALVLGTPELLENILLHLDIRALLTRASRVCRQWHCFITTVPSPRRVLLLEPYSSITSVSPLCQREVDRFLRSKFRDLWYLLWRTDESQIAPEDQDTVMVALNRPEASWRSMLVAQPPIYTLAVLDRLASGEHVRFRGLHQFPQGLRLGQLHEIGDQPVGIVDDLRAKRKCFYLSFYPGSGPRMFKYIANQKVWGCSHHPYTHAEVVELAKDADGVVAYIQDIPYLGVQ